MVHYYQNYVRYLFEFIISKHFLYLIFNLINSLNLNLIFFILWPLGNYGSGRNRVEERMKERIGYGLNWKYHPVFAWGDRKKTGKTGWAAVGIEPRTSWMRSQRSTNWATVARYIFERVCTACRFITGKSATILKYAVERSWLLSFKKYGEHSRCFRPF